MDIVYDETRFGELLLYLAELSCGDRRYNRGKLAKQLFHCDFEACRLFGRPITGAIYRMHERGPLADTFHDTLARLEAEHRLVERRIRHAGDERDRTAPTAIDLADLTLFASPEIDLARSVVADLPHRPPGWRWVSVGGIIPYPTVPVRAGRTFGSVESTLRD